MEQRHGSASELMAKHIMEGLQESGERDFIKDWLMDDLESVGWKAYMFQKASEITSENEAGEEAGEEKEREVVDKKDGEKEKPKASLKTFELASRLSKLGHDAVPNSVRVRLLNQLLQAAKRAVEAEQCQPTKPET